jgi:hypothetical protein
MGLPVGPVLETMARTFSKKSASQPVRQSVNIIGKTKAGGYMYGLQTGQLANHALDGPTATAGIPGIHVHREGVI